MQLQLWEICSWRSFLFTASCASWWPEFRSPPGLAVLWDINTTSSDVHTYQRQVYWQNGALSCTYARVQTRGRRDSSMVSPSSKTILTAEQLTQSCSFSLSFTTFTNSHTRMRRLALRIAGFVILTTPGLCRDSSCTCARYHPWSVGLTLSATTTKTPSPSLTGDPHPTGRCGSF